jgi:hypothetical protein
VIWLFLKTEKSKFAVPCVRIPGKVRDALP